MKRFKRIAMAALALVLCFSGSVGGAVASDEQNTTDLLYEDFAMLLSNINADAELFDAIEFEMDEIYIGIPHQTYILHNGQLLENSIYMYPFLYEDTVIAVATVGLGCDGSVEAVEASTFLSDVFQNAYDQRTPFALVYEHGALYCVTTTERTLLQEGYDVPDGTAHTINTFNFNTNMRSVSTPFRMVSFTETKVPYQANAVTRSTATTSKNLSVPCVNQNSSSGGSSLCWASSVASIGEYKISLSYTPQQVCYLFTSSNRYSGSASYNVGMAFSYIPDVFDYLYALDYDEDSNGGQFTTLIGDINNDNPIYANFSGTTTGGTQAHAVVLCGYSGVSSAFATSGSYTYMDPNGGSYKTVSVTNNNFTAVFYGTTMTYAGWISKN